MNPIPFISSPRTRKLLFPLALILASTTCLWTALCGTSDITDNPSQNGGYNRNAIFFLQSPVAVTNQSYAHPLSLPITNSTDLLIPAGTRLQVTHVISLYGIFAVPADNSLRMVAQAKFLDGPLAGTTINITAISALSGRRNIKLDPAFLQPTPPKPAPTSISTTDAMELLQNLPETQSFLQRLSINRRHLAFTQESAPDNLLQFALSEDSGIQFVTWNRFRINPQTQEITIWNAPDDTWLPLTTWRTSITHPTTNN